MLLIPNLHESPFHRVDAALSLPLDQLSVPDHENYAPFEGAWMACIPGEKEVFATVEIGHDTSDLHAYLSLSFVSPPARPELARYPDPEMTFSPVKWEQSDPDSIWEALTVFLGKTLDLFVEVSFSVGRDDLPVDCLVASMIGLRTKAGEEQFLLSGAQFTIRGFPEDTVSWYLTPGSHGRNVSGQLARRCMEQFHSESIGDAVHVLDARFNRIVRAQSNIKAHAAS